VVEAVTEERLGVAALGTAADLDAAVRAAQRALGAGPWGRTTARERAEGMLRFADALDARGEATSTLVARESGMPIALRRAGGSQRRLMSWACQRSRVRGVTIRCSRSRWGEEPTHCGE
jgi:acyl-CoA reductase-like NAD-dependent aldehyde dehydrogenase